MISRAAAEAWLDMSRTKEGRRTQMDVLRKSTPDERAEMVLALAYALAEPEEEDILLAA